VISYAYSPFLQSFGGDLVNRDSKSADGTLNGPAALNWANWLQGLVKDGYIEAASGADTTADFVNGKSAILYSGSWAAATVTGAFGDDVVAVPPPNLGSGSKTGGGSWEWGMTQQCNSPAAASAYLTFAHQTKYFVDFSKHPRPDPRDRGSRGTDPELLRGRQGRGLPADCQEVRPHSPRNSAYPYISSVFQKATQDILSGGNPKTILDKAASDIDTDRMQNDGYKF